MCGTVGPEQILAGAVLSLTRLSDSISRIGLLNEKPLHASLKQWYAQPGDRFEVPVDGFVIDIVRDNVLLEIQTRHFGAIKSKLATLVSSHQVRLIYPIAQEKWIVQSLRAGSFSTRRKSPKRGRVEDLFRELVAIPRLLSHRNFSLEVLLTREEERRRYDNRRWRRRGWVTEERRLLEVVERRVFEAPGNWLALLPDRAEPFTSRDLAEAIGVRVDLAQKMTYSLREAGLVQPVGKKGRAILYQVGEHKPTEPIEPLEPMEQSL